MQSKVLCVVHIECSINDNPNNKLQMFLTRLGNSLQVNSKFWQHVDSSGTTNNDFWLTNEVNEYEYQIDKMNVSKKKKKRQWKHNFVKFNHCYTSRQILFSYFASISKHTTVILTSEKRIEFIQSHLTHF